LGLIAMRSAGRNGRACARLDPNTRGVLSGPEVMLRIAGTGNRVESLRPRPVLQIKHPPPPNRSSRVGAPQPEDVSRGPSLGRACGLPSHERAPAFQPA